MIELDLVLSILREMQDEASGLVLNPGENRDAFAFGKVHGMLLFTKTFEERLKGHLEEEEEAQNRRERD